MGALFTPSRMPLAAILACAAIVCAAGAPTRAGACPQEERAGALPTEGTARFAWFNGSFEELLGEAARTKRLVFLNFHSSNAYSKKLERGTLSEPRVTRELAEFLCLSIDADAKESKLVRRRYQVQAAPALVFLESTGEMRDQLTGYLAPDAFLMELRRIKQGNGTLSGLRSRLRADPGDLEARWDLALKLRALGDLAGFEEQVGELRERDPEGRSRASKRMRLASLHRNASATLDLEPLYRFVEEEREPRLLFEAWHSIWMVEGQALRGCEDPERRRRHQLRYFAAARALFPLVPPEKLGFLGNDIAWYIYENRAGAAREDLEFALTAARAAVQAAPSVPAVIDTLACCLFALGQREEAQVQIRRAIELDPQNPEWRERLGEFQR
jgi:tetratricopeptide (TPR) repeat protein